MKRHNRRRAALRTIKDLLATPSNLRFIHYSCESFYDRTDGTSPRVTSIAVAHSNGQTRSFSIHQAAERDGAPDSIEDRYDELELKMLKEFFQYVKDQQRDGETRWIHWNMRDTNYGFAAIEHRFQVIGGELAPEFVIQDSNKADLSMILTDIFGRRYADHPRLKTIVDLNGLTDRDFLVGAKEAEAFERREYLKLHQSTLRKVNLITSLATLTAEGKLKTKASWSDRYGVNAHGLYDWITESAIWKVGSLLLVPLGAVKGIEWLVRLLS